MKNSTLLVALVVLFSTTAFAQKKTVHTVTRCATMEAAERYLQTHPQARQAAFQAAKTKPPVYHRPTGVQAIVNVPVVFHIVLPNPNLITDATCQAQIDALNRDFSGLNNDSTNAVGFYPVRGHSIIRFVLAKRTPAGTLTNGIDRIASNTVSDLTQATDPIKRTASGGADAWSTSSYLNYWVGIDGSGNGILGYAQFPGLGNPADDGIFCNAQTFGVGACNDPAFNKGRTMVHETGHYFGLLHIWGDDGGACSGDDFRAINGSTVVFPSALFNPAGQGNTINDIGDTPNQTLETTNCPAGQRTDGCSPNNPGYMYQNYMDYTEDNCYSMFTKKQVERMEWILDNVRSGLKTSLGGTAPAGSPNRDAAPFQSVNPGGFEIVGCAATTYTSRLVCSGPITPKVRIRNNGQNPITSVTVGLLLDNVAVGTPITITPNLNFGFSTIVSFPAVTVTGVGAHTIKFYTSDVNGAGLDQVPTNDTLTTTVTVNAPSTLPAREGFEGAGFPPTGFTINNPNGDFTWVKRTPGNNSANSMFIDNYNNDAVGRIDELRTPKYTFTGTDSIILKFDVAHRLYPGALDRLSVFVSKDCGATFTQVYSKAGAALATGTATTAPFTNPTGLWRTERVAIGGTQLSAGELLFAFRNTNDYGNNIFVDNINIYQKVNRDIKPETVLAPSISACLPDFTPRVTVRNEGSEAVTSFNVGYSLNGGTNVVTSFTQTIPPGGLVTLNLPAAIGVPGPNTISIFTINPATISGSGDQQLSNDTITYTFNIASLGTTPLTEGFEAATFPPTGWTIFNPAANTWERTSPGRNSSFSMFIDNYDNATLGAIDEIRLPVLSKAAAVDSVIFSFDLAHKYFNNTTNADTLSVLVSADCGATFTTVYRKWGNTLSTAGTSTAAYVNPLPGDWRRERIALGGTSINGPTLIFKIRNGNRYGNNIFVDNINIVTLTRRNLQMVEILQPKGIVCDPSVTPSVVVKNVGYETINDFKVNYSLDNGTAVSATLTGVNLAPLQLDTISLSSITPAIGLHALTVYTSDPVSTSGTGDQDLSNDTLVKSFTMVQTASLPVALDFEAISTATFPPAGWGIDNPDASVTWNLSNIGKASSKSTSLNGFNYPTGKATDVFASPSLINDPTYDSVLLSFDYSYRQGAHYPGTTVTDLDTLEVQVTNDCGLTRKTIWRKWGNNLQTVADPNQSNPAAPYAPVFDNDWRNVMLDLGAFVNSSPNFQVYFVAKSNKQNNLYIDNINIYPKVFSQRMKDQGYMVYPNPFNQTFKVHHVLTPVDLQGARVYNAAGKLVWEKRFNGDASKEITVDLSNQAKGVYVLKLVYTNKTVVERIVKN